MTRTQVYFTDEHKRELTVLAAKKKKKFSQVLRDVIESGLKNELAVIRKRVNRSDLLKKFVGFDKSKGNRNLSKNIDKILYAEPYE